MTEYELVMVNQYGDVEVYVYSSLKDVADKILEGMEEAVAEDLVLDLPEDTALFRATLITTSDDGLYYVVEEQHGRWRARHVIPASKADYYTTGEEILSNDGGSSLYVRARAVRVRSVIYHEVFISRTQIKDLEAELKAMLEGGQL
jgi:hypothetical protein